MRFGFESRFSIPTSHRCDIYSSTHSFYLPEGGHRLYLEHSHLARSTLGLLQQLNPVCICISSSPSPSQRRRLICTIYTTWFLAMSPFLSAPSAYLCRSTHRPPAHLHLSEHCSTCSRSCSTTPTSSAAESRDWALSGSPPLWVIDPSFVDSLVVIFSRSTLVVLSTRFFVLLSLLLSDCPHNSCMAL